MQYTVAEIIAQTNIATPFAVPTVLEARNSEYFFPAPAGRGVGYTVDLRAAGGQVLTREFLHVRLTYKAHHLLRVAQMTGPTPQVALAAARDAHLAGLRTRCTRPDYGAMMTGEVDA